MRIAASTWLCLVLVTSSCGTDVELRTMEPDGGPLDAGLAYQPSELEPGSPYVSLPRELGFGTRPTLAGCGSTSCLLAMELQGARFTRSTGNALQILALPTGPIALAGGNDFFCGADATQAWMVSAGQPTESVSVFGAGGAVLDVAASDTQCIALSYLYVGEDAFQLRVIRYDSRTYELAWESALLEKPAPASAVLVLDGARPALLWARPSADGELVSRAYLDDAGATGEPIGTVPGHVTGYAELHRVLVAWDDQSDSSPTEVGVSVTDEGLTRLDTVWSRPLSRNGRPERIRLVPFENGAHVLLYPGSEVMGLLRVDMHGRVVPDINPVTLFGESERVPMALDAARLALFRQGASLVEVVVEYR